MAASGVSVHDDVVTSYNDIKLKHNLQFVQYKLSDDLKEICVDKMVGKGKCKYEDFTSQLPDDDCRYAIYDYAYSEGDSGEREKLVFIVWCPDTASVKKKMLYASSKDALKKKLVGISVEFQGTDKSDITECEIIEKCKRHK